MAIKLRLKMPDENAINLRSGAELQFIKDYNLLENLPSIEGVELIGDKSFEDLGLVVDTELNALSDNPVANSAVADILKIVSEVVVNGETYPVVRIYTMTIQDAECLVIHLDDGTVDGMAIALPTIAVITNLIQNLNGKEDTSNKVVEITSESTDTEYPSAKAVYDFDANKPYFKCVWYSYLLNSSNNRATLEIVNGGTIEEALKQPVQMYGSVENGEAVSIGQAAIQYNPIDDKYFVVFPQSVQWVLFLARTKCGGASFAYNEQTGTFTFVSLIKGTELLENKVTSIPATDVDLDVDRYPSVEAIRRLFDGLHSAMGTDASDTKTLVDLILDSNGNLTPTFSNIAFPVSSVNNKTGEVSLNAEDVGAQEAPLEGQAYDSTMDGYCSPMAVLNAISQGRHVSIRYLDNGTLYNFSAWSSLINDNDSLLMAVGTLGDLVLIGAVGSTWTLHHFSIPTQTSDLTNDGADGTSTYVEADELAAVATSGSYNDLTNKPSIPSDYIHDGNYSTVQYRKGGLVIGAQNASEAGGVNATNGRIYVTGVSNPLFGLKSSDSGAIQFFLQVTKNDLFVGPTSSMALDFDGSSGKVTMPNDVTVKGKIIKNGGTSDQFLKADGSVDSTSYSTFDGDYNSLTNKPAKTSDFANDGEDGTSTYVEADQLANVATSGSYNDLSDKPTIGTGVLTIQKNGSAVDTFSANATDNKTINITVPTTASEVSALPASTKYGASIVVTVDSTDYKITTTLKDQDGNTLGTSQVIDLPLESVVVSGSYDNTNQKIVLTLQNGSTVDVPVGDLVAGLQSEITAQNPLSADYVDDSNSSHKFTTAGELSKLAGIEAGAEVNVQPDWSETDSNEDDYIKNKPTKTSDFQNDGSDGNAAYLETDETAYKTASIPYGECDSTSTATAFTATVPGITELRTGVMMMLKNGIVTSAANFTININGLGAKPSYNNMTTGNDITPTAPTRDTTIFNINYTMLCIYSEDIVSGGGWIMYRGYDANTNTIGYQIRTNSQRLKMTDQMYRYRLMFTGVAEDTLVPANSSTSTNATSARTPITRPINPFGPIYYYGYTTAVSAGSRPAAGYYWQEYVVTLGYSFTASALTAYKSLYLVCSPQADGSAIIDASTPYTQDLPSTADGKIYIFLGVATSETAFELNLAHPIFYHDGNGIKLWTGFVETDPTVPAWAKASSKPTYTAAEVGAQVAPLIGQIDDNVASDYVTPLQVAIAVNAGRQVFVRLTYLTAPLLFSTFNISADPNTGHGLVTSTLFMGLIMGTLKGDVSTGVWSPEINFLVDDTIYGQIPSTTSQLTNDSDFTTKAYVDGLVGNVEAALAALR